MDKGCITNEFFFVGTLMFSNVQQRCELKVLPKQDNGKNYNHAPCYTSQFLA